MLNSLKKCQELDEKHMYKASNQMSMNNRGLKGFKRTRQDYNPWAYNKLLILWQVWWKVEMKRKKKVECKIAREEDEDYIPSFNDGDEEESHPLSGRNEKQDKFACSSKVIKKYCSIHFKICMQISCSTNVT